MMKQVWSFLFLVVCTVHGIAQDRSLGYYIDQALQHSPLLQDLQNQVNANHIDSLQLRAGLKPQVYGVSSNSYAPVIHGYGYEEAISNIGNFNELLTATKELVGRGNLDNQVNAIRLARDSLHFARVVTTQDIKRTITEQYIATYGSWEQYAYDQEMIDLLNAEDTVLKRLTRASVYRQTDYLIFLVTLKQQQLAVAQAKMQFRNDHATLNYLCGLVDTSFTPMAAPSLLLREQPGPEESVYYQKFRIDSLLLLNQDARIDFAYKPKVNLYADAGFVSTLMRQPYRNFGTSFGINLTVPIYDGKQRKMQHNRIAIAEQTRQRYRDFFAIQYNQQVAQLVQQLSWTQQLIDDSMDQLKYSQGLIDANRKLLVTGDVRMSDYVIAIGNYLNAKNIITQNMIRKYQIINQLNYWSAK